MMEFTMMERIMMDRTMMERIMMERTMMECTVMGVHSDGMYRDAHRFQRQIFSVYQQAGSPDDRFGASGNSSITGGFFRHVGTLCNRADCSR